MAVSGIYVLNLLTDIAKEQVNADLGVTISESSRGAVKVGATALVSSLVLGPVGFLVGSVGGGIWAYTTSSDFKPLYVVIAEMTQDEKDRVVSVAMTVANERSIELALGHFITSSPQARSFLMEVMRRAGIGIKSLLE